MRKGIVTTVRECARCEGVHVELGFVLMERPIDSEYPYWSLCPETQEPILLRSESAEYGNK